MASALGHLLQNFVCVTLASICMLCIAVTTRNLRLLFPPYVFLQLSSIRKIGKHACITAYMKESCTGYSLRFKRRMVVAMML